MKLAIVHDDLIQFGGAEKLVLAMHELWPDAPIYTSAASEKWLEIISKEGIELETSFMQKLPFIERLYRYYSPFLLHAMAFEQFDFSEFDVVLSVSARYAHGVITKPGTKHICYMNSPGRMLWEPSSYFKGENYGLLSPIKFMAPLFLKLPLSILRAWDYAASRKVDYFVANSRTPQERIKKYYRRDSVIIYPFVDYEEFSGLEPKEGDYFLVLTRLAPWKKVEIAVRACSEQGLMLKIVGTGPDESRLKSLAGKSVEFLGYVSEKNKKELLSGCTAVINTQKEDFGIVPLEAMASGKPVIAYKGGGVLETVVPGKTGEFFTEQTADSLTKALKNFDKNKYSPDDCRIRAAEFDKSVFINKIRALVDGVYSESGQ